MLHSGGGGEGSECCTVEGVGRVVSAAQWRGWREGSECCTVEGVVSAAQWRG